MGVGNGSKKSTNIGQIDPKTIGNGKTNRPDPNLAHWPSKRPPELAV